MLRGKDGALTYDFEPVPNVIASNGVPLIKLKTPDILYSGSDSFTFTVSITHYIWTYWFFSDYQILFFGVLNNGKNDSFNPVQFLY